MIWVTSDLHFQHETMIESGLRPYNFEKKIIKNWNALVKDTDTVLILGDVAWRNDYTVFKKLKGRKILVKGNHDSKSCEAFLEYFDFACDTFTWHYNGIDIIFSHEPLKNFSQDLNIHSHVHNRTLKSKKHLLISIELMGYGVHSLPALVRKWKEKSLTID